MTTGKTLMLIGCLLLSASVYIKFGLAYASLSLGIFSIIAGAIHFAEDEAG